MTPTLQKTIKFLTLLTILAGGMAALGGALFTAYKSLQFYTASEISEGTIVKMEQTTVRRHHSTGSGVRISTSPNKIQDIPIIRYSPEKDKWVEFKSNVSFGKGQYKIGNTLPIRYIPGEPQQARINSGQALWFLPVFLLLFGSIFTAIGLFLYKKSSAMREISPPCDLATARNLG